MIKRIVNIVSLLQCTLALTDSLEDAQTFLNQDIEAESLTQDDFEGLMKYLYQTCDGP